MKKLVSCRLVLACILCLLCIMPVCPQSSGNGGFPEGSTQGTSEMSEGLTGIDFPNISFSASAPQDGHQVAFSIELLLLLSILTLAPSIMLLCTCFLRFSIVLDFIKRALSLQQVPPTAVLNGIALFMAIFCMRPTFQKLYTDAFKPLSDNEITLTEAYGRAEKPIKLWMFSQMDENMGGRPAYESYVGNFMKMARMEQPRNLDEVPMSIIIPSYILHELTVAFKIGVLLYIPFIVIDMVVASILMSMGMMMLPPVQISMPFKLMLFVLVDGWGLLTSQLFNSVM
ncbi:MAG: flagellar type III secretion system pore protein FliP [Treponema sp.]|nr:flagellar type III secretion system pore protein FliP [Treponema sp.]